MKLKDVIKITRGKLLAGKADTEIDLARISSDSRNIKKGDIFLALKGLNFDGDKFAEEAFRKGAAGAIVSSCVFEPGLCGDNFIIQVKDTTKALQDIAAAHRKQFDIPVVCVTGSNGKTTVKDMIWQILSSRYNVLRNEGTKNNHIGVPQTLLKLNKKHDMCVLELGTNHKGEIASLAAIARPTACVFTNVGPSHLEFLDSLEGVFEEKREVLKYLDKKDGTIVLNGDDEFLSKMDAGGFKVVKYGLGDGNDLKAEALKPGSDSLVFVVNNKMVFELNLFGSHNIYNALAAIAIALDFGIDHRTIREALKDYKPTYMRLELENVGGIDILNDSYNSNPLSMLRALEVVKYYHARAKWVVTGDMLELGGESERFHKMIGESAAKAGIEGLVAFGELSKHTLAQAEAAGMSRDRLWHCSTHDEIAGLLKKVTKSGDVILLKGSRSMRMEQVLHKLKGQ
ncbi:MAG: UDP-N-acetylmuramoyl-tripeptide--D-alanyl-D-alanine ligase [Candidatus Omnitrophica bacterium]|nr:UDP-N-acetylmuramoyl-tripeptide--D-alanyl-D-alanine ligase [Candidatus Omnitrophota bacterium]